MTSMGKQHAKTTTSIHEFIHHTQIYPYMYLYNLKKSPPLSIFSIYNTGSHQQKRNTYHLPDTQHAAPGLPFLPPPPPKKISIKNQDI